MKKILITTLMAMLMTATICADETNIPPKSEGIEEMSPSVNMTKTQVQVEEYYTDEELLELGIWKEDNTVIIEDSNAELLGNAPGFVVMNTSVYAEELQQKISRNLNE